MDNIIKSTTIFRIIENKIYENNNNQNISDEEITFFNTLLENRDFDIIIFAIENKTSIEFIRYVISIYKTLNYYILTEKKRIYITSFCCNCCK